MVRLRAPPHDMAVPPKHVHIHSRMCCSLVRSGNSFVWRRHQYAVSDLVSCVSIVSAYVIEPLHSELSWVGVFDCISFGFLESDHSIWCKSKKYFFPIFAVVPNQQSQVAEAKSTVVDMATVFLRCYQLFANRTRHRPFPEDFATLDHNPSLRTDPLASHLLQQYRRLFPIDSSGFRWIRTNHFPGAPLATCSSSPSNAPSSSVLQNTQKFHINFHSVKTTIAMNCDAYFSVFRSNYRNEIESKWGEKKKTSRTLELI